MNDSGTIASHGEGVTLEVVVGGGSGIQGATSEGRRLGDPGMDERGRERVWERSTEYCVNSKFATHSF